MRGVSRPLLLLILAVALSCSSAPAELTGIDWERWKSDRNGCESKRIGYVAPLKEQINKLKARSEMDIVNLMGRPDETELLKRNQKFYSYYLAGSPACPSSDSVATKLVIRFNAMGLAKEVALEP